MDRFFAPDTGGAAYEDAGGLAVPSAKQGGTGEARGKGTEAPRIAIGRDLPGVDHRPAGMIGGQAVDDQILAVVTA